MRSVIVTGAASGIGRAIAEKFASAGDTVMAADVIPCDFASSNIVPVRCDVSRLDEVQALVQHACNVSGTLDVLCNNAGIRADDGDVITCEPEGWDRIFDVNIRAVYLSCHFAIPVMLRAGGGAIINIASLAGLYPLMGRIAYCASKGAVISLTRQVALQYAGAGIRSNCICPGPINTPGARAFQANQNAPSQNNYASKQPMKRLGTPEEIASTAYFLASEAASYVTGSVIIADGGVSLMTPMVRDQRT